VAALNCSVVPAHPWIYGLGQQTDNGAYLSPVNAVRYLAERLAGTGGNADVMIMMVTGQTHENFMTRLNGLVDVFPAPAFTQVKAWHNLPRRWPSKKCRSPLKPGRGCRWLFRCLCQPAGRHCLRRLSARHKKRPVRDSAWTD
jgi:hypothetical protein